MTPEEDFIEELYAQFKHKTAPFVGTSKELRKLMEVESEYSSSFVTRALARYKDVLIEDGWKVGEPESGHKRQAKVWHLTPPNILLREDVYKMVPSIRTLGKTSPKKGKTFINRVIDMFPKWGKGY